LRSGPSVMNPTLPNAGQRPRPTPANPPP
jgi:hypothetical protein